MSSKKLQKNNTGPTRTMASIVDEVENLVGTSPEHQADALRHNDSAALRDFLTYAFNKNCTWLIPLSDPPYKPLPKSAEQEGKFTKDMKMLRYFTNTADGMSLTQRKREEMFIQMLESIDPDDAMLLLRMRRRDIRIPMAAIRIAFPDAGIV